MSLMPPTDNGGPQVGDDEIQRVVLQAMHGVNLGRGEADQIVVSPDAPVFGPDSPLDSLGLVGLLLDIEEGMQAIGCPVVLSDERAVSQKRSPFRSVQTLVAYIAAAAQG
jgi:acyl carrier protein